MKMFALELTSPLFGEFLKLHPFLWLEAFLKKRHKKGTEGGKYG